MVCKIPIPSCAWSAFAALSVACGLNLKWLAPDRLVAEYSQVPQATVLAPIANVGGERVRVSLRSGVIDSTAPGGGMLYNLERDRAKR